MVPSCKLQLARCSAECGNILLCVKDHFIKGLTVSPSFKGLWKNGRIFFVEGAWLGLKRSLKPVNSEQEHMARHVFYFDMAS